MSQPDESTELRLIDLNFVHMLSAVSLCDQMSSVLRHV